MKKHLFDLQLFAEEAENASDSAAVTEQGNTQKDKEPAPTATPKDKGEAKYTDEDVNKLLNQKFAEWQKKKDKEIDEAAKLASMDATEKVVYERDQAIKERDELKAQMALADMTKTARKILADNGITVGDELLSMFVSTDAKDTKAAVDTFTRLFKETVESAVKDRLRGEPPKKGTGGDTPMSEIDKRLKKYL